MDNNYYNKLVLLRVDTNFNRVLPIGALVSIASAIAIYFSTIGRWYAYVDIAVALLLMLIYLMRHTIPTDIKVFLTVVIPLAEGVETKEQHDQFLAMDCKIIQGYYYAKPEPL